MQHEAPADSPLFAEGGRLAELHADLHPGPAHLHVRKRTVSVFAGTDLGSTLKARGVTHLLVSGLMTHACVAGAARDAVPLGFEVVVAATPARRVARIRPRSAMPRRSPAPASPRSPRSPCAAT